MTSTGTTWKTVTSSTSSRVPGSAAREIVTSYISDSPGFEHMLIFDYGGEDPDARWRGYSMNLDLIGGLDLETKDKLVAKIRNHAVNAILFGSGPTLEGVQQQAAERAREFKQAAGGPRTRRTRPVPAAERPAR